MPDDGDRDDAIWKERQKQDGNATMSEALREMIRAHLAENAEALRLLHEAAKRPGARYPIDMSKGYAMDASHWSKLRSASRLLKMQASFAATEGDIELAVDALLAILATAESLREEPILVEWRGAEMPPRHSTKKEAQHCTVLGLRGRRNATYDVDQPNCTMRFGERQMAIKLFTTTRNL